MFSLSALVKESLILSSMSALADKTAETASHSLIGGFLTSYDKLEEKSKSSIASLAVEKSGLSKNVARPVKKAVIKAFEGSRIISGIQRMLDAMLGYPLKFYGVLLLTFGIYALLTFGIRYYIDGLPDFYHLAGATISLLLSLLIITLNTPLSKAVNESALLSALLFNVIGIRRERLEETEPGRPRLYMALIIGMLLGLATYLADPLIIVLGVLALLALYTILVIPEAGVTAIIFLVPFLGILPHPSILTALMLLYVAFCTFLKLIRGKRTLHFEIIDWAVTVFLILTLLGGVFSASRSASLSYALIYCCLMLGYPLVVILIRTEQWIRRCVGALAISSVLVSLYGVYQNFLGVASTKWQDSEMFGNLSGRITSTFENPNVLAEYLIMCIPFALALLLVYKGWGKRIFFLAVCGVELLALVYTMSRGAWLGFMIGIFIFLLILSRKTLIVCFFGILCIPALPFVLPDSIIQRFTSIGDLADSSTAYRVHIWEGCIAMIRDFFVGGIGVGKEVFAMVYPSYTLAGIESAPHAHNLYLQIIIETGIFGIFAFLLIALLFTQSCFSFFAAEKKLNEGANRLRLYSAAAFCGVVAVAAQGMTDYIWYNYRVFLFFWLMVGLGVAARRSAVRAYSTACDPSQL